MVQIATDIYTDSYLMSMHMTNVYGQRLDLEINATYRQLYRGLQSSPQRAVVIPRRALILVVGRQLLQELFHQRP